jgi:dimethylaniline monooxygenase (N-oxide forming)
VDPNLKWGAFFEKLMTSRLAELMVHKPGQGFVLSLLATVLSPVRWLVAMATETYYKALMAPMRKHGMVPDHSFSAAMLGWRISALPERFYETVDDGGIVLRRCGSFSFCAGGVVLDVDGASERVVDADVVILATGFDADRLLSGVFVSPWFRKIVVAEPSDTMLPLYRSVRAQAFLLPPFVSSLVASCSIRPDADRDRRSRHFGRHCVHPRIPQMAVVGYAESAASIYPYEMMAKWVAHLLDGAVRLPNVAAMERSVAEWEQWGRWAKRCSGAFFLKSCIATATTWYHDQLCRDMGYNPRRKRAEGFLADWLQPYGSTDYAGIL